jgi:hypothetical protein
MNTNNNRNKSTAIMNIVMIVIAVGAVVFVTYKYLHKGQSKSKINQKVMKKQKWTHKDSVEWDEAVKNAHAETMAQQKKNIKGAPMADAIKMAQKYAKDRMDFPETVSFEGRPISSSDATGYSINQELVERSGDGTFLKFKFSVKLIFLGGSSTDKSRWTYNEMSILNEASGREIIFGSPDEGN